MKVFEENLPTIRIGFDIRLIFRFLDFPVHKGEESE
ncbi:hypothetical protein LSS_12499 [Leptospira santarosai serovar Shermani str. LT 821]|uniref:Uncharacterized protein n=1 Tax=Leptospira santarosai serovar Shermani str. LT 821 TaxID=758847 RepID=K8Y9P7_9LEPT|nr:hypothetical protein LSS_12499 [Leptospira santarosai serovar Shermani str. LT 821]